jgi:hypothetical protein
LELSKNADILIHECAAKSGQINNTWPHTNPKEAAELALNPQVKQLLLFHFIIEPTQDISDGKIYILRISNEVVARHTFKEARKLKLLSSNSKYQIIIATEADILGRVILAGGWKEY